MKPFFSFHPHRRHCRPDVPGTTVPSLPPADWTNHRTPHRKRPALRIPRNGTRRRHPLPAPPVSATSIWFRAATDDTGRHPSLSRHRMKTLFSLFLALWLCGTPLAAQSHTRQGVKRSTDALMFVPAAAGLAASLSLRDYTGTRQLCLSGATALGASYLLELCCPKKRPDGDGNRAFPSTHTTAAFAGAAFVQRRYGWKWGAPAYAVAGYVAWGRVYSKRHDVWDVLAGAALGVGAAYAFTRPLARGAQLSLMPAVLNGGGQGVYASITF